MDYETFVEVAKSRRSIRVCPFNKPQGLLHDAVRGVIRRFPRFHPLIVKADDWLGYGKKTGAEMFWRPES